MKVRKGIITLLCGIVCMFTVVGCNKAEEAESPTETSVVETTEAVTEVETTEPVEETTEAETEPPENSAEYKTYYSVEDSDISIKLLNPISNSIDYILYNHDKEVDSGYISLIFADTGEIYGYSNSSFFIRPKVHYEDNVLSFDYSECTKEDYGDATELYEFVQANMASLMSFRCEEDKAFEEITDRVEDEGVLVEEKETERSSFTLNRTLDFILENSQRFENAEGYSLYLNYSSSKAINYSLFFQNIEIDNGSISLLWANEGKLYAIPSYALLSKNHAALLEYDGTTLVIDYNTIPDKSYIDRNYYLAQYLPSRRVSFTTDYDVIANLTGSVLVAGVGYLSPEEADAYYSANNVTESQEQAEVTPYYGIVGEENLGDSGELNISTQIFGETVSMVDSHTEWQDSIGYSANVYQAHAGVGDRAIILYIERNHNYYPLELDVTSDGAFSKVIDTVMSRTALDNYHIEGNIESSIYQQLINTPVTIINRNNKLYGQKIVNMPNVNATHVTTMLPNGIVYGAIVVSNTSSATADETLNLNLSIIDNLSFSASN